MTTYILRRLLLMIPTLIGITFLVFMLIANAPGGIGAGQRSGGGGGAEAGGNAAVQQAYFEDRYGLNDPATVQYIRWLGRVSPLKFGDPDLRDPTGEIIRTPKPVKDPELLRFYSDQTVEQLQAQVPPAAQPDAEQTEEEKVREYRRALQSYTDRRAEYIGARTLLKLALVRYADGQNLPKAEDKKNRLITSVFDGHDLNPEAPEYEEIQRVGGALVESYLETLAAQRRLKAAFDADPFPQSVFKIGSVPLGFPGTVYLAPSDLGRAFSRSSPVGDLIGQALPVTLLLNAVAIPIIYIIAVPTGLLAAVRRGSFFDMASGSLFVALWSIPVVWAGVLCVGYLANNQYLGAFPTSGLHSSNASSMTFLPSGGEAGYLFDTLWHLVLPVFCLVYAGFAVLSKQTRAAMLDNFNADYVRTAKAKGVAGHNIVLAHVFRNSLLPLITMFASVFPAMLAGSVVIESVFSIPGMGALVLEAINQRDRELLLANTLMIGIVNVFALLLADILYALADPRIAYD